MSYDITPVRITSSIFDIILSQLVFDGSRQSPTTYNVTYAPTVRAESVRLFHLYAVEYGWQIQQYDVPQAFLRSDADCTIFVYPPRGQSDFPDPYNLVRHLKLGVGLMLSSFYM